MSDAGRGDAVCPRWSRGARAVRASRLERAVRVTVAVAFGGLLGIAPRAVPGQDSLPAGLAVLREGRFTVAYAEAESRLARSLLTEAQRADSFPGLARPRLPVLFLLAPDDARFREWVGPRAPEWGAAIAFPALQRIVMYGRDAAAESGDPRVTLRHELAHLALFEALGPGIPRWFDEGYASYAAGEWGRDQVIATSLGLVWRGMPTLAGLDSGFYGGSEQAERSYALAHRAVAELAAMNPDRGLAPLMANWQRDGSFERALRQSHGMSSLDFERFWRGRVRRQFGALALAADLSVLSVLLTLLLGPMWWQRRQRNRRRLERLREADAAQEVRERESALAALLGELGPTPRNDDRIKGS